VPGKGLSSKSLREAAVRARAMARERAAARLDGARAEYPEAAEVAQRVYNSAVEARRSGESGDVSPILWAPLVTVVVRATDLPNDDETLYDVAAYFVASFIAGGLGFDRAHFEEWRRRSEADSSDVTDPASEL
jgi:hypothetical protein